MESLLFLCHRLPFPPNKGDKIRAWHFLQHLARRFRVHLGTFIDDPDDEQWRDHLASICASVHAPRLRPRWRRLAGLGGLWRGEPLSVSYYRHAGLSRWIGGVLRSDPPARVFVFSSGMGQYLEVCGSAPKVVDFVDVDSEKWRAYADHASLPQRLVYRREARRLLDFEVALAGHATASLFVSETEAALFKSRAGRPLSRIHAVRNGVDVDFFKPDPTRASPYAGTVEPFVFTGAMDYHANIDAVEWFAREIWPRIRARRSGAAFFIVGARPDRRVRALVQYEGVAVTGTVPDVRPYLQHARVVVAPLRIARGVQNKVLEAMAMNKPVVGTSAALEGIAQTPPAGMRIADDIDMFASACVELAGMDRVAMPDLRAYVLQHLGWSAPLAALDRILADPA